jgi:hypothetical protein
MVVKQSLCALTALGFLSAGSGLALADPQGGARYAPGNVLVHIESGLPGQSSGRLTNAGASRGGTYFPPVGWKFSNLKVRVTR